MEVRGCNYLSKWPQDKDCSVCLDPMSQGDSIVAHTHGGDLHPFHERCLRRSFVYNPVCPMCREPIDLANLRSRTERFWQAAKRFITYGGWAATSVILISFSTIGMGGSIIALAETVQGSATVLPIIMTDLVPTLKIVLISSIANAAVWGDRFIAIRTCGYWGLCGALGWSHPRFYSSLTAALAATASYIIGLVASQMLSLLRDKKNAIQMGLYSGAVVIMLRPSAPLLNLVARAALVSGVVAGIWGTVQGKN